MKTELECSAAAVAIVTAYLDGDEETATTVGLEVTGNQREACATLGFVCGMSAALLTHLEQHGHDAHAILADMGLRIARGMA